MTLEVGQLTCYTLVVEECDVDDVCNIEHAGIECGISARLDNTHIFHTLDGDVMEVLTTNSTWMECVPAGGYGSEGLHIVLVSMRIEDEGILIAHSNGLEKSEISVRLVWLLVDVVIFYIILV